MLKAGTPLVLHSMDSTGELAEWELKTDVCGVQVLRDHGDSVLAVVLLPGYGVWEVRRDQVVLTADTRPEGGVTSLHMEFNRDSDDVSGFPKFLEVLGSSLTRLSIDLSAEEEIWTGDMLKSCPNLKALVLRGRTTIDTESFLTVYRESNLQIEELDCPFDVIGRLARELTNTNTAFAKTIKRLAYRFATSWRDEGGSILLADFVNMLNANHTLEYLHVAVPSGALIDSHRVIRLRSFNDQVLPARSSHGNQSVIYIAHKI